MYAWVVTIWASNGDNLTYPRLASALIHSLLSSNTMHDICLLADPICTNVIQNKFPTCLQDERVKIIPFAQHEMITLRNYQWTPTHQQKEYYSFSFNQKICSKALAFKLTQYEKIILLDADCIVQLNCDNLFTTTNTPAATFANIYSKEPHVYGRNLLHNDVISSKTIHAQFDSFRGFVCSGTIYVIQPSDILYDQFRNWISSFQSYGHKYCLSGIEEQAFAEFFLWRGDTWHHVHPMYQAIPWKPDWVHPFKIYECPIVHFIHDPPFLQKEFWPDTAIWWKHDKRVV